MARSLGSGIAGAISLCFVLGAPAWAQTMVEGMKSVYVVDGRTTAVQESFQAVELLPPAPTFVNGVGDALWRQTDGGQGWIGRNVSLGDNGTQVFCEFDTATDRAQLVSGFDVEPVTPLFADWQTPGSTDAKVDAAENAGVYVASRQVPVTVNGPRNSFVSKYSATGGLGWTYQFPGTTYGPVHAKVSRDGTRIVAGMLDSTGQLQVRVFNSASNVPIHSTSFQNGPQLRSFLLTSDGSTLYWASASALTLWNVNTHQTIAQYILFNAQNCHAISGDGRVFAYGGFNFIDLWERQATGTYLRTHQWTVPGQAVCSKLDVSDDGSTVVAGFNLWDTVLGVHIMAFDVPTKAQTMSDIAIGAGTLQNIVSDIAASANGDRFVVGLWGDEAGLVPELRFYRRHQNAPVATWNYPGSVYDVEISHDGHRVAVATKAAHANLALPGGSIDLYAFEDEDLVVTGIPRVNSTVRFDAQTVPSSPVKLLMSPQAALVPFDFGGIGTLYLNRQTLSISGMGVSGAHGYVSKDFTLPPWASVGSTLCFQAVALTPRRLTETWIKLTVLP